jgi:hypothetical protein
MLKARYLIRPGFLFGFFNFLQQKTYERFPLIIRGKASFGDHIRQFGAGEDQDQPADIFQRSDLGPGGRGQPAAGTDANTIIGKHINPFGGLRNHGRVFQNEYLQKQYKWLGQPDGQD